MNLLALDPGLNHAGLALFYGGELHYAWTINPKNTLADVQGWRAIGDAIATELHASTLPYAVELAYEMPQLLAGWKKGDQNAILQVAGAAGTICERLRPWLVANSAPIPVRPSEWTKSRPKKANHLRMWNRLTLVEQCRLAGSLSLPVDTLLACIHHGDEAELEHALDAVCIGLFALGRFGRET